VISDEINLRESKNLKAASIEEEKVLEIKGSEGDFEKIV
jgi:hypothetical protein